jgi:hypothetical protein
MLAPFDGFHETEHAVTGTCLISFDRNRYSVMAKAARRPVQVRAYADRIIVRCGDATFARSLPPARAPPARDQLRYSVVAKLTPQVVTTALMVPAGL